MADNFVRKTTNFDKTSDVSLTFYNEGDLILLRDGTVHIVTIKNNQKTLVKLSTSEELSGVVRSINGLKPDSEGRITIYQPVSIYKTEDENNVYLYATAMEEMYLIATQPQTTLTGVGSYPNSNPIKFKTSEINGTYKATVPKGSTISYVGVYFANSIGVLRKLIKIIDIPAKTA